MKSHASQDAVFRDPSGPVFAPRLFRAADSRRKLLEMDGSQEVMFTRMEILAEA